MALQYYSEQRLDELKHLYNEDKLFRTFSPVLCRLQEERGELHPVILWHEVEALRERLKRSNHPETEIFYLIGHLRNHLAQQTTANNQLVERDEGKIVESMLCILLLLFFQLSDATPSEENLEANPNHVLCATLAHVLVDPKHEWYVNPMHQNLTSKKTDILGNKIVLPVVDYMKAKVSLDAMDEVAKRSFERAMEHIHSLSQGLQAYLNISFDKYIEIWQNICAEPDLHSLICKKQPRTYELDFNLKMFCNVLGLLQNTNLDSGIPILKNNVQEVNNAIGQKNYRNYITYYNVFDGTSAYTKDQFTQITRIISDTLTEQPQ